MKMMYKYTLALLLFFDVYSNSASAQTNLPVENDGPSGSAASYTLTDYTNIYPEWTYYFNYHKEYTPLYPTSSIGINLSKINLTTTYWNGWGKPLQSIKKGALVLDDMITPYDQRAKLTTYSFLPYSNGNYLTSFHTDPFNDQQDFYNSPSNPDYNIENGCSFSVSQTEVNTTDNILYNKSYAPGASMMGSNRGTTSHTIFNSSAEGSIWAFGINAGTGKPEVIKAYGYGEIQIKITRGQHNAEKHEYFDKNNQLILTRVKNGGSWLVTEYVYDDFGKLIWLLTPRALVGISGVGWTPTQAVIDGLCYHYVYNSDGQIAESKIPDQEGVNRFIYDKRQRQVLSQTPLLNQQGKWAYSVYDSKDRVAFSGIITSSNTPATWKTILSGTPASGTIEYYLANGVPYGYWPPTSFTNTEVNIINYYDSYDNMPPPMSGRTPSTAYNSDFLTGQTIIYPTVAQNKTFGQLVGSRVRVLDPANNNLWTSNVFFYNKFGKLLQAHTQNHWSTGSWDLSFNQYNFSGELVFNILEHNALPGSTKPKTVVMTEYDYHEHTGWLNEVRQNVDNSGWKLLSAYTYDKAGRLTRKSIGNVELQDYNYNIRGQLTGINKKYVEDPAYHNKITFGEGISYDYGFNTKRYDGSISGYMWRGTGAGPLPRAYGYGYDDAGRMTFADYNERSHQFTGTPPTVPVPLWGTDVYSTYGIVYDNNGNMEAMNQNGIVGTTPTQVDQLIYQYNPVSNRLRNVIDNKPRGKNDFFDGNTGTNDFSYDKDGNLTSDLNKGIGSIVYNYMDLPTQINVGSNYVNNIYDGAGNLVQKTVRVGTIDSVYKYCGPFVYRDNGLQYFTHAEGRTRWLKDSLIFKNDFFVKDHLGNVRSVVTSDISYGSQDYWNTFEIAAASVEESLFDNVGPIRDGKPLGTPGDIFSGKLDGSDPNKRIGTSILFRVRPEDQVTISAWGYYEAADSAYMNTYAPPEDMFDALVTTFNSGGLEGGGEGGSSSIAQPIINGILNPVNYDVYEAMKNNITDPAYPRMYLNYLVFDETMTLRPEKSSVTQFKGGANKWTQMLGTADMEAEVDNNYYVLAYLSMESGRKIFMDNYNIVVINGRQLEEQHYYPHGRLIDPTPATNPSLRNNYLYQTKELQTSLGIELYDFHARQYDAQLGRFWGVDPANEFPNGYTGMGNDPANFIDPTGMKIQLNQTSTGSDAGDGPMTLDVSNIMKPVWRPKTQEELELPRFTGGGGAILTAVGKPGGGEDENRPKNASISPFSESGDYSSTSSLSKITYPDKYGGLDAYRAWQEYPGEYPGETWLDRFARRFAAAHREEMLNFGGGGYNMYGGYGKLGQATQAAQASQITLSELQLLTKAAQKAEAAIGGTGRFAGSAKHTYAINLLKRYQSIYGNRGLSFNYYFNNNALYGKGNRGFLDVISHQNRVIYDFKFGNAFMSNGQFQKYSNNFPGYSIHIIRP